MAATTNSPTDTDRIEKRFEVKADRSRVWRAISDATEFATWFGVKLDRSFAPGARVTGRLPYKGVEHVFEMQIEELRPETYFSYRWHPYAMDTAVDYSAEPTTLVEFRLEEVAGGTVIIIVESGFDRLPASRRGEAFRMNEGGWTSQSKKLANYVG